MQEPAYLIFIDHQESRYILQDVGQETFCGVECLIGRYASATPEWLQGSVIRVPVDKIKMIVEYNSLDDCLGRFKSSR